LTPGEEKAIRRLPPPPNPLRPKIDSPERRAKIDRADLMMLMEIGKKEGAKDSSLVVIRKGTRIKEANAG
jgi:hypothetical protein